MPTPSPLLLAPKQPGAQRGFALVIALSLMAFIVLLVLSLSTLLQVESRSAETQLATLEARQNAHMAAVLALGELQKAMGPDTRVSARAEMLSSNTPDASGDADETTRFWTGAWSSQQEWLGVGDPEDVTASEAEPFRPYKGDREERFVSWLVSLPSEDSTDIDAASNPVSQTDDTTTALLANIRAAPLPLNSSADPVPTQVRAPLRSIGDSGSIAWWVSDEGVKANVGLVNSMRDEPITDVENIPAYLFPHRENFGATGWFGSTDFDDDDLIEKLRKLSDSNDSPWLAFQEADTSALAEAAMSSNPANPVGDSLLSDYTMHSFGLLTNNKKGGFRDDLSLAFWRAPGELSDRTYDTSNPRYNADFSDRVNLHGRIFNKEDYPDRTVRATLSRQFFGPQWDTLRDFHNSYQKFSSLSVTAATSKIDTFEVSDNFNGINTRWLFGVPDKDGLNLVGRGPNNDPLVPGSVLRGRSRIAGLINSPVTPIIKDLSFYFQADMTSSPTSTPTIPTYQPRFKIFAVITLWNPYSVSIEPLDINGNSPIAWTIHNYIGRFEFLFEKNGGEVADFRLATLLEDGRQEQRIDLSIPNQGSNLSLAPGEIRQYRLLNDSEMTAGFSEESIVFGPDAIDFDVADSFESGDELRVTMTIPNSQLEDGGGTEGVIRVTLFDPRYSGRKIPFGSYQTLRFNFFEKDTAGSTIVNFQDAGPLAGSTEDLIIGGVEITLKAANDAGGGMLANFNPRALYPGGALVASYPGEQGPNYTAKIVSDNPNPFPANQQGAFVLGFWGDSNTVGDSFVQLFDVPKRPPESLGQYQHANLSLFGSQPAYPFGNSMAHPHVRRELAHDLAGPENTSQIDLSWFLNDAIWDDYFLSTIDKGPLGTGPSTPERDRFLVLNPNRTFTVAGAEDYQKVAENLLLRGAFNVNSTSVEAWTAFLSGLGGNSPSGNLDFPYHRMSATSASPNSGWTGGPRDLTAAQIRQLAEQMVEQVKLRGPFLSLSDFVNRRLESGNLGEMGALQAALEAANVNTGIVSNAPGSLNGAPVPANLPARATALAPGDVSQADVLTTIGPKMSVRSDTFLIRSYGRVDNPISGEQAGEAWCEMLVQRFPDDILDETYGRPFKVLSFRFLNQDEI